jgi:4-diphosphocytidyl-2-C-methyl-D-erythritol kinase
VVEPVDLPALDVVLVPDPRGLSTEDTYAELDRRAGWRERLDPEPLLRLAGADVNALAAALENDLEPAARALLPEIDAALGSLRRAGALGAAVSGSGPTCFGLFATAEAAAAAAHTLPGAIPTRLRAT